MTDILSHDNFLLTYLPTNLLTKKFAFTLAEVLITLGIIGVVAALTMPALIAKHQKKVLETQFKKSVSIISQVILNTKNEMGIENLKKYCTEYDENDGYTNDQECKNYFYKNLLLISQNRTTNISRFDNETIKTYNSKQIVKNNMGAIISPVFNIKVVSDGGFIGSTIIEGQFYIAVDVNGKKAPNKLGHDIFIFKLDANNDTLTYIGVPSELTEEEIKNSSDEEWQQNRAGNPCNLTSNQSGNGIGCSYYALRNECPYDSTRQYFECLP